MILTAIENRIVYRIETPDGTKVVNGDRCEGNDLDLITLPDGTIVTGWSIVEKARKGEHGMRILSEEPMPDPVVTERSEGATLKQS